MKKIAVLFVVVLSFVSVFGDDVKAKEKVSFDKLQPSAAAGNEV